MELKKIINFKEQKEIVIERYKLYTSFIAFGDESSEKFKRLVWFSDEIMGITTYDDDLSFQYGEIAIKLLAKIADGEGIWDYTPLDILVFNFIKDFTDWGTSIRGCWIDYFDSYMPIDSENVDIKISEEFLDWLLLWLNGID